MSVLIEVFHIGEVVLQQHLGQFYEVTQKNVLRSFLIFHALELSNFKNKNNLGIPWESEYIFI